MKSIFPLISIIFLWFLLILPNYSILRVGAIGNPDEYGNCICWHTVEQWNGSAWVILLNYTSASEWSQRVVDNMPIRFQVQWRLNNTLADSEAQAVEYTKILMNITTGIWENTELNNTSTSSDANYYYGVELGTWNQTGYPQAGVTYDVSTKYQAYY